MDLAKRNEKYADKNRDVIQLYIELHGEESRPELSELQLKLLDRWRYADEIIRKNNGQRTRELLARDIMDKYGVSRDTAYSDMRNAELVFESSMPLNKKYFIQRRIEFIERKIYELYVQKDNDSAVKLEAVLQKYIGQYPDYVPRKSPKTIIYQIGAVNVMNTNLTAEQALEGAQEIIEILQKKEDY
ncbi:MAG: hypothetical protein J0L83_14725 [Chitinophagales bacterium]|nr:hypothetical protein [Chitinophagales bacterium]